MLGVLMEGEEEGKGARGDVGEARREVEVGDCEVRGEVGEVRGVVVGEEVKLLRSEGKGVRGEVKGVGSEVEEVSRKMEVASREEMEGEAGVEAKDPGLLTWLDKSRKFGTESQWNLARREGAGEPSRVASLVSSFREHLRENVGRLVGISLFPLVCKWREGPARKTPR